MSDERGPSPVARATAFGVTWLSYATYYVGRKGFSVTKARIVETLGPDALTFYRPSRYVAVGVETAYLATYAIGQVVNGLLGDRIGARRLIALGMLLSAAACVMFGLSNTAIAFTFAWALNGFAQSSGWPGNVKAMAEWTTPENRGVVMGAWSTCYQVGGLAATALATVLLIRFGWRYAFFGPAALLATVGIAVYLLLRPGPGSTPPTPKDEASVAAERARGAEDRYAVLKNGTIWCYGFSYFFIKLIRYSLLFWLPFYLKTVLHYSESDAGYFSTAFEIGGVVGTIALGRLSDRYPRLRRSGWSALSLLGLAASMYLYGRYGGISPVVNFSLMALVGALLFGPDALLSGAAAQDAGGPRAAGLAAGLVNGIGSTGAILQELVTRGVSDNYGWGALFNVFLVAAVLAALALVPTMRRTAAA